MRRISTFTALCAIVLLGCAGATPPEPQLKGTIIGPAGGDFSFLNGALVLRVPAGAVANDIGVEAVSATEPQDPAAIRGLSYALLATPSVQFLADVSVELKFDPTKGPVGVPESHMRAHRLSAGAWQLITGDNSVNTSTHTVTFKTRSLETFGVKRVAPQGGCSGAEHRQFDFWIGEWTLGGGVESSITSDGCAIFELYRPNATAVGKSISVYDESTGKWNQTYQFSTGGQPLILTGGLENGKMVMYDIRGGVTVGRWTWSKQGSIVTQTAENSTNNGATYTPGFSGTYTPKP